MKAWWPVGHVIGYEHTFVHEFHEFIRAIAQDRAASPDFIDGVRRRQALDAVDKSIADGRWITVSDVWDFSLQGLAVAPLCGRTCRPRAFCGLGQIRRADHLELPDANVGLEWEPCHQMVKLIDPMPRLRTWARRIFHVHGKDATIKWDVIRQYGVNGPKPWAFHRTPGFGDSDWTAIISALRQENWSGAIDIEGRHDPVYRDVLEMTGQVHALNHLKACRGGVYIPNPTM